MLKLSKIWDALTDYHAIFFRSTTWLTISFAASTATSRGSSRIAAARGKPTPASRTLPAQTTSSGTCSTPCTRACRKWWRDSWEPHHPVRTTPKSEMRMEKSSMAEESLLSSSQVAHNNTPQNMYRKMPNTVEVVALTWVAGSSKWFILGEIHLVRIIWVKHTNYMDHSPKVSLGTLGNPWSFGKKPSQLQKDTFNFWGASEILFMNS